MKLHWQDVAIGTFLAVLLSALIGGVGLAIHYDNAAWLILSVVALAVFMAG